MPMSLHVFEERYQEMMRDSLDSGTSFGVVAIRDGKEVGGEAVPRGVGTLARIVHVERLPDGRINLLITGRVAVPSRPAGGWQGLRPGRG